ncbi:MAG: FAD-binding protein [Planctomycetes bacterium]|nr:FAD-binding protein [Planctomycetota bacterium]
MNENAEKLHIGGIPVAVHRFNTVVVGSGAAGLNAAEYLHRHGQKSVAVITEGLDMGTSRNTGSDKQTYYKLTLGGEAEDSVRKTARTLFDGGAMDGDIALAEAAGSAPSFFRLVDLGVPFPHNAYGEFIGYKTDHDPVSRGSSCGPLTSKFMTERLLAAVRERGIPIFDRHQVIELLVADGAGRTLGALALDLERVGDPERRYALFAAANVVYATGGEAGMYECSVYPPSQCGSTGIALRAGAKAKNLTESQYGITSVKFRWNLSGTYQQVLPRYLSADAGGGDEREFLDPYFPGTEKLLSAIFLKGYQWPFDPRKIAGSGSSLIDILVYHETVIRGRRVFLDYTRNPYRAESDGKMDFSKLTPEVHSYLVNSGALLETPIARLAKMNPAAIELYMSHGIDLAAERLEIAVSAQHNNGGLAADKWWQSNIRHLFPIGEVNGSHGVYRPGGSALNSGQVGGMRAARYILAKCGGEPPAAEEVLAKCGEQLTQAVAFGENALARAEDGVDISEERRAIQQRMSCHGAHIRSAEGVNRALGEAKRQLVKIETGLGIGNPHLLRELHQLRDLAVCHFVYLFAIKNYIEQGGVSRGSYLIQDASGEKPDALLPETFRYRVGGGGPAALIQEMVYLNGACQVSGRPVRPLPAPDDWFETVWQRYQSGDIYL